MRRARDRWLNVSKHAQQGMLQERPAVTMNDLEYLFEDPDHDDGKEIRKRIGKRTICAYYSQDDEEIHIRGVTATRSR